MRYNKRVGILLEYEKQIERDYLKAKNKLRQCQRLIKQAKFDHVMAITDNNPLVKLATGDGVTGPKSQGKMRFREALNAVEQHMKKYAKAPNYYSHDVIRRNYFDDKQWHTFWLATITPLELEDYPVGFFEVSNG